MDSEAGKEFGEWLISSYDIKYYEERYGNESRGFYYADRDQDRINGGTKIINNLAVEWLDSKEINQYTLPDIDMTNNRELCGFSSKILYNKKVTLLGVFKTRQEAIVVGVVEGFQLLNSK